MSEEMIVGSVPKKADIETRNYNISLLRLIAMVSIIVCHFLQFYNHEAAWWLNSGVQVFFIISGYLYSRKKFDNPVEFYKKSFLKIYIPYIIFTLVMTVLYLLFNKSAFSIATFIKMIFCLGYYSGLEHLWFVSYILFCYLFTPLMFRFLSFIEDKKECIKLIIIALLFIAFFAVSILTKSYFNPVRIVAFFIGYVVGFYSDKYNTKFKIIFSLLVFALLIVTCGVRIYFSYIAKEEFKGFDYFVDANRILIGLSFFVLFMYAIPQIRPLKLLVFSDKYSYCVYLVHQLFILSYFNLMGLTSIAFVNILITVVVIVLCSLGLYYLVRFFNFVIDLVNLKFCKKKGEA